MTSRASSTSRVPGGDTSTRRSSSRSNYPDTSTSEIWTPSSSEDGNIDLSPRSGDNSELSGTRITSVSTVRSLLSDLHLRSSVDRTRDVSPQDTPSTDAYLHDTTPTLRTRSSEGHSRNISPPLLLQWSRSRSPSITALVQNLELEENEVEQDGDSDASHSSPPISDDEREEEGAQSDLRQEQLPRAPIYDGRLQNALRDVKTRFTKLKDTMDNSPLAHDQNSDFYALYEQVKACGSFEYPETRTVGFIGDSGVGRCTSTACPCPSPI